MKLPYLILFIVALAVCVGLNSSCAEQVTTDPATGVQTKTKSLDPAAAVLIGQGLGTYAEIQKAKAEAKRPQVQTTK